MECQHHPTPANVAREALTALLTEYKDRPVLLLLSGGSSAQILEQISPTVLPPNITVGVIDERYTPEVAHQNWTTLQTVPLIHAALEAGNATLVPAVDDALPGALAAQAWAVALRTWKSEHKDGVVIATLGIGPDGHIAGIFPGTDMTTDSSHTWTRYCEIPASVNVFTKRLTVTPAFLVSVVDAAVVYAVGAEKRSVLTQLLERQPGYGVLPAALLWSMHRVTLYTDIW